MNRNYGNRKYHSMKWSVIIEKEKKKKYRNIFYFEKKETVLLEKKVDVVDDYRNCIEQMISHVDTCYGDEPSRKWFRGGFQEVYAFTGYQAFCVKSIRTRLSEGVTAVDGYITLGAFQKRC